MPFLLATVLEQLASLLVNNGTHQTTGTRPEHMANTPKKALVPPLTAQVNQLDSEMNGLLKRQDITRDEKVKLYDQTLQRYLKLSIRRSVDPSIRSGGVAIYV